MRTQKLIKGAKKEGTLTLYSTTPPADANATIAAFQKKYGVKVQLARQHAGRDEPGDNGSARGPRECRRL